MTETPGPPPIQTLPDSNRTPVERPQYAEKYIQTVKFYELDIVDPSSDLDNHRCSDCKTAISISSDSSSSSDVMEISDDEEDGGDEIVGGL